MPILITFCILLITRLVVYGFTFAGKAKGKLSSVFWIITMSCLGIGIFINLLSLFLMQDALPGTLQTPAFYFPVSIVIEIIMLYFITKLPFGTSVTQQGSEKYTCDDGHVVKSRGEALLDNWLAHQNINHEYEQAITVAGKNMKYDWYLPDADVYIEYWGFYTKEYQQRRKEKEQAYAAGHKKLVSITNEDLEDINVHVKKKLLGFLDGDAFTRPKRCFNCGAELDDRYK